MQRLEFEAEYEDNEPEALKTLLDQLASIPNFRVWKESDNEIRFGRVPQIFAESGSRKVEFDGGWVVFRKDVVATTLRHTTRITIFCPESEVARVTYIIKEWQTADNSRVIKWRKLSSITLTS